MLQLFILPSLSPSHLPPDIPASASSCCCVLSALPTAAAPVPAALPLLGAGAVLVVPSRARAAPAPWPRRADAALPPLPPRASLLTSRRGDGAGLAGSRAWVNLWCYSGLGSWYELPSVNPSRMLGQRCSYDPAGQHPGFLPLDPTCRQQRRFCIYCVLWAWLWLCLTADPVLLCCNPRGVNGSSLLYAAVREARTRLTDCTLHNSGFRSHLCVLSALERALTLIPP